MSDKSKFDIDKFNKNFEESQQLLKNNIKDQEAETLQKLSDTANRQIKHMSVLDILIGIKDTWFDILDDFLEQRFTVDILLKGNRMFFVGLTIIIIVLIIYLSDTLFINEIIKEKKNVSEIHHIYHIEKPQTELSIK